MAFHVAGLSSSGYLINEQQTTQTGSHRLRLPDSWLRIPKSLCEPPPACIGIAGSGLIRGSTHGIAPKWNIRLIIVDSESSAVVSVPIETDNSAIRQRLGILEARLLEVERRLNLPPTA